eukprot:SAG11_NODE_22880_length_398_cov_5.010033_1_plen_36_part_01
MPKKSAGRKATAADLFAPVPQQPAPQPRRAPPRAAA